MKSSTAIAVVVIISLIVAGIFLFSNQDEETPLNSTGNQEIIPESSDTDDISELETSDDVFDTIDDALRVLE